MKPLAPPESHHLDAAIGWLGLCCAADARAELEKISAKNQDHPDVLDVRWTLSAHDRDWDGAVKIAELELKAAPEESSGWLHRAYALRRMPAGGLPQAWDALLPAANKFPAEPLVAYNLSCYACQMQQLDSARNWLMRALRVGKKDAIKKMVLADDDLQPLWKEFEAF